MTIPNLITILRFCFVPFTVWCIGIEAWMSAFWVFTAAGISDGVDGFIARRFDQRSELGAILDPLADKALLVSIYVALGIVHVIPVWLVITVVFRDLMIIGAVLVSWQIGRSVAIRASYLGKANTAAQILFAQFVLFTRGFGFALPQAVDIGSAAVGLLTIVSVLPYLRQWLAQMAA
jgi:cardiolipin synthase (CMP-forming)